MLRKRHINLQQFAIVYLLSGTGLLLIVLGMTGRLHWLAVLLGGLMPFLAAILRNSMGIFRTLSLFKLFSNQFGQFSAQSRSSRQAPKTGQTSSINTVWLVMSLDHDSGELEGEVLQGTFEGKLLSQLTFEQLMQLLNDCEADQDSTNVLVSYLDRSHENWQDQFAEQKHQTHSGDLDESQALAVLGLDAGASKDAIIKAHRSLIQKVHPDRGGSTYLAARINEAKSLLIRLRDN